MGTSRLNWLAGHLQIWPRGGWGWSCLVFLVLIDIVQPQDWGKEILPEIRLTFLSHCVCKYLSYFNQSTLFQPRLFHVVQKAGRTFEKENPGPHVEMNERLVYHDESDEEDTDKEEVENSDDEPEEDA